jgi:(+)-pinoresinol hydroxylase
MILPPGISQRRFASALREFEQIVGKDWVFSAEEDLATYRDSYSPYWDEKDDRIPPVALCPANVEQVRALLKVANTFRVPLWPVSTGKNLGYGGSAPAHPGTGVLDLKRMNRILEVDDKNHYALVEPGVSYFDLYRHIRDNRLKVWIDSPDPGWGSPMGNTLDRGVGRTPMQDHWNSVCGLEVVLPNGDLVRTGMGAIPNSKSWQHFKYGFGPYVDGIFSQSSYGVVTKMGVWLYPEPEAYLVGRVTVYQRNDVIALVDLLSHLMNTGVVQGQTYVTNMVSGPDPELLALRARPGGATEADIEAYARTHAGYWSLDLPMYGATEIVAAKWQVAQRKAAGIPGAKIEVARSYDIPMPEEQALQLESPCEVGVPSLNIFNVVAGAMKGVGHMFAAPVIPMTGAAVIESLEVMSKAMSDIGFKDYITVPASTFFARSLTILVIFAVSKDREQNRRSREALKHMVKVCGEHGWGDYRAHASFMTEAAEAYSFNDHALRRLHETIKDALDPNGIISPGKAGIRPRNLR